MTHGFSWSPLHTDSKQGKHGELDFAPHGESSTGFVACPVVPGSVSGATYKIYAAVPGFKMKKCIKLGKLRTTEFKKEEFGAWQYN